MTTEPTRPTRPLRFCHLATFYPPWNFGGDGIGIQRLCKALARRGHEVTVLHDADAFNALHSGPGPVPEEQPENLRVEPIESGWKALSPLLTQQTGRPVLNGRRIAQLLAEGDYDVINFHNASLIGGPGLFDYGDAVKLYMAHEHWLVCESHVLWRHGRELCTGRQCLRCVLHHKRPPQLWRYTGLMQRKGRAVDRFIAMSEFSRGKHAEFGFPFPMEVLPYFLPDPAPDEDPASSPARLAPRPHQRPYFLFVGRLELIKGLDQVIPLFREYTAADLLIAGAGEYGDTLRELARGIEGVHFLGRISPEQLGRYYAHAEALIVPSVCFETFGIILIEAFRNGTPVIARRIGPFPEIVERAQAGELFETTEELLAAMHTIVTDPALRAQRSANGLRAFREHWTESAVVPRYLRIVAEAAREKGDRRVLEALGESAAEPLEQQAEIQR